MFFIKIYIKESYINYYDTSIQMCGQYCILAPEELMKFVPLFEFGYPLLGVMSKFQTAGVSSILIQMLRYFIDT